MRRGNGSNLLLLLSIGQGKLTGTIERKLKLAKYVISEYIKTV